MQFKVYENLPAEVVDDLRAAGHEAETVTGQGLRGVDDPSLLAHVQREGRVLLTMDKGIADIRTFPPEQYAGIILLRPQSTGRRYVLRFVRRHLATLLQTELGGHLLIVSEAGIRIR